jgi:hypothetical protein
MARRRRRELVSEPFSAPTPVRAIETDGSFRVERKIHPPVTLGRCWGFDAWSARTRFVVILEGWNRHLLNPTGPGPITSGGRPALFTMSPKIETVRNVGASRCSCDRAHAALSEPSRAAARSADREPAPGRYETRGGGEGIPRASAAHKAREGRPCKRPRVGSPCGRGAVPRNFWDRRPTAQRGWERRTPCLIRLIGHM